MHLDHNDATAPLYFVDERQIVAVSRNEKCKVVDVAVLAASPDGAALYKTLGFVTHAQPVERWFYLPTPPLSELRREP
jgi:hypothetical protein